MSDIPRGPENIPLEKIITDLPIVVLIKDLKSGKVIREEHINYSDREKRSWLGRITVHSVMNGYSVESMAEKDYKKS